MPTTLETSLAAALSVFGGSVTDKLAGDGEPEDQLRGPFETLLQTFATALGREVVLHGETLLSALSVRPDYAVRVDGATCGHVELKAPGKGANPSTYKGHDRSQWQRLKVLPNVLYSDGNSWALYRSGVQVGATVHVVGDVRDSGAKLQVQSSALAGLLTAFLNWEPTPPTTAEHLADTVAGLCRLLRDEVQEALATSAVLLELAKDWRQLLFPGASTAVFADGYAQSVTFALLLARADNIAFPTQEALGTATRISAIASQLGKTHSLLGRALRILTNDEVVKDVLTSADTLLRVIGVVDWKALSKGSEEPWLHFYEHFLALYDPALRKRTGSYYTPNPVVAAMTWLTEDVLREHLGMPTGFADDSVTAIDPAMGTGTFLLHAIEHVAQRVTDEEGPGAVPGRLKSFANRLHGFEIQTGPYAVAQLRGYDAFLRHGVKLAADGLKVYVADTLDSPYTAESHLGLEYEPIAASRRAANKIKAETRITVVIGNPPYKDKAKSLGGWVTEGSGQGSPAIFADFTPAPSRRMGPHVRHIYNLYAYFWRWALWKAFEVHPENPLGVVSLITSASWLDAKGFGAMRSHIRSVCDHLYILHLGGESRGSLHSENVFDIQVPVAIAIAVRDGSRAGQDAEVHYSVIDGSRSEKYAALSAIKSLADVDWQAAFGSGEEPIQVAAQEWRRLPALTDLFPWQAKGIMAGRTWVFAPDVETLKARWQRLLAADQDGRRKLMVEHKRDRPITKVVTPLPGYTLPTGSVAKAPTGEQVIPPIRIGFRSFDRQWLIPDHRLLNVASTKLWTASSASQLYATTLSVEEVSAGPALTFTSLIPDVHHFRGTGGGDVFPLWRNSTATAANVAPSLLAFLSDELNRDVSAEDLFAYAAGILSGPGYQKRYAEELATPGLRLPITRSAETFFKVVGLGQQVIWLQTYGARFADAKNNRPSGPPRLSAGGPKVIVAIPDSSDGMPADISYDEPSQTLRVGVGTIAPVSRDVWNYQVSNMRVIRKWFGYRGAGAAGASGTLMSTVATSWPAAWTTELLDMIHVLQSLVNLEPSQAAALDEVVSGSLVTVQDMTMAGVFPVPDTARDPAAHGASDAPLGGFLIFT